MIQHTKRYAILVFLCSFVVFASYAFAHNGEEHPEQDLTEDLHSLSSQSMIIATCITAVFSILAIVLKKKFDKKQLQAWKKVIFVGIVAPLGIASLVLIGSTIYLNFVSETGGPVHWHADFEIWSCGEEINIIDPTGIENRVGTPVLHEHNDNRVHVEGVVVNLESVNLENFIHVLGGSLTQTELHIPINTGEFAIKNGDECNGIPGELQFFVYKTDGTTVTQQKLEDGPSYILTPDELVPPGDCLVIEFGAPKERTDHVCTTYEIALNKGELHGG